MQSETERAKSLFPGMPEYVFKNAIGQFIPDIGWPFLSIYELTDQTNWCRLFHPFSLLSFSSLSWKFGNIKIDERLFDTNTRTDINIIIANQTQDILEETGRDCEACRRSLMFHKDYIVSNGKIYEPITVAVTSDLFIKIVDGNHRIAALKVLNMLGKYNIPAWLGNQENT